MELAPHDCVEPGKERSMATVKGLIPLRIYPTDSGYIALEQPSGDDHTDCLCLLSVDQVPDVIRELETLYANRQSWAELARE
jgi:hypothetical protein